MQKSTVLAVVLDKNYCLLHFFLLFFVAAALQSKWIFKKCYHKNLEYLWYLCASWSCDIKNWNFIKFWDLRVCHNIYFLQIMNNPVNKGNDVSLFFVLIWLPQWKKTFSLTLNSINQKRFLGVFVKTFRAVSEAWYKKKFSWCYCR